MKVLGIAEVALEFCLALGVLSSVGKRRWNMREIFPQLTWNNYDDKDGDNDDETTNLSDDYNDDATHFTDDYDDDDDDVTRSMDYLMRENIDVPYWMTGTLFPW